MAARRATVSLHITPEAKAELDKFKRNLAVRVDANVDYSAALRYAIAATESTHEWLEGGKS